MWATHLFTLTCLLYPGPPWHMFLRHQLLRKHLLVMCKVLPPLSSFQHVVNLVEMVPVWLGFSTHNYLVRFWTKKYLVLVFGKDVWLLFSLGLKLWLKVLSLCPDLHPTWDFFFALCMLWSRCYKHPVLLWMVLCCSCIKAWCVADRW